VTAVGLGWRSAAAAGLALVLVPASVVGDRAVRPRSPGAGASVVTIDPARAGRAVPPAFLGFSIEWDSVEAYAGPRGHRRVALRRLLAALVREAGPVALRVGGDTADQAWWNPGRHPRPRTVLQDVTPATLDAIAWLAGGLRGPVTLDLNLALRDPRNALALSRAARRRLPPRRLETLELGNEPDLYTHAHTFRVPGHVHRRVRKHARYGPAAYVRDVSAYLDELSRGMRPTPRLAVAGFAGGAWWRSLPAMLKTWRGRAGALSGHLYALPDCRAPTPPAAWLESPAASRVRAASLARLARIGDRSGLPMRVTELNSAACGGRPGVSDTFAAALWLTDTLFALVHGGADQADLHTWAHARYAPFEVTGARVRARPPLTGMRAFARAAPTASRLVGAHVSGGRGLRTWATVDAGGTVRVALIAPAAVQAEVVVPGARCGRAWVATAAGEAVRRVCAPAGRVSLALPGPSLAVVTLTTPARATGR
jgi:hypothetical protein